MSRAIKLLPSLPVTLWRTRRQASVNRGARFPPAPRTLLFERTLTNRCLVAKFDRKTPCTQSNPGKSAVCDKKEKLVWRSWHFWDKARCCGTLPLSSLAGPRLCRLPRPRCVHDVLEVFVMITPIGRVGCAARAWLTTIPTRLPRSRRDCVPLLPRPVRWSSPPSSASPVGMPRRCTWPPPRRATWTR